MEPVEGRQWIVDPIDGTASFVLGLSHPDKHTQSVFGRLMGGRRPGYTLTSDEITTALSSGMITPFDTEKVVSAR